MWDDTINYKRFLTYSYFFDKFFTLFFTDNLFFRVYAHVIQKNSTVGDNFSNTLVYNKFFFKNLNVYFGKI